MLQSDFRPHWLHWLDTCPSTNSWAIDQMSAAPVDLAHGDVVFTPRQTAGRGQQGRVWYAPPGVLTASVVLHNLPTAQLPGFSLVAGLAVIYAVEDLLSNWRNRLQLKWPNDVWLEGRKLAGLLCEAITSGATGSVIVGIGLNYQVDFASAGLEEQTIGRAVSLHQVTNVVPNVEGLLERLRHYLLEAASLVQYRPDSGLTDLLPALRARDALLGRTITLAQGSEQLIGEAVGLSDRGHLLLRLPSGEVRPCASGHVLVNPPS